VIAVRLVADHPDRLNSVIASGAGLRLELSDPQRAEAMVAAPEADAVSAISDPAARFYRNLLKVVCRIPMALLTLIQTCSRLPR
jgi:pimeloyl-ACP methyl ester carboxylesterase